MDLTPWTRRNFVILTILWFLFIALSSVAAVAEETATPNGDNAPTMGMPLERMVVQKWCEDPHHLTVCLDGSCITAPCEKGSLCLGPDSEVVKSATCFPSDPFSAVAADEPGS